MPGLVVGWVFVLIVIVLLAVPIGGILLVVLVIRALSRAARRDSAGRADEQRALTQLLGDIERMEKRVGVLETILSDESAPVQRGSTPGA